MTLRVDIRPEMIDWALQRAGKDPDALGKELADKVPAWLRGEKHPTLKQLEMFASKVHVPLGYLFLPEPPEEPISIPDFRTFANREVRRPSPDLLDTIYICQQRQEWYREYAEMNRLNGVPFINTKSLDDDPRQVAQEIAEFIGFGISERAECKTWEDSLRLLRERIEDAGVLVMTSGIVGANTHRKLNVEEFRGFALSDDLAPLIFINGVDTKAGQIFTLAHELAHLWLGQTALSNIGLRNTHGFRREEIWCNRVAAELLVPTDALREALDVVKTRDIGELKTRLARHFKVSTLVILRRLLDVRRLERDEFEELWAHEVAFLQERMQQRGDGGSTYKTLPVRLSRRFLRALFVSTLEGHTLFRDAYRLMGVKKAETFQRLGKELGVLA